MEREFFCRNIEFIYPQLQRVAARSFVVQRGQCEAADIVQSALLEAWRRLGSFHGSTQDELVRWLRSFVLNQARNESRRHLPTYGGVVNGEMLGSMRPFGGLSHTSVLQNSDFVGHVLDQLEESERAVVCAVIMNGETICAASKRLGIGNRYRVRRILERAIGILQILSDNEKCFDPEGHDDSPVQPS